MRRAIQPRAGVLLVSYARESKEVTQLGPRLTFKEAAIRVLEERGPMHYRDLAGTILDAGWVQTDAVNPSNSLNAMIAVDIRRNGLRSPFIRLSGGIVGLRTRDAAPKSQEQHRDVEVESRSMPRSIPKPMRWSFAFARPSTRFTERSARFSRFGPEFLAVM